MSDSNTLDEINRRLGVVIALLLRRRTEEDPPSMRDHVKTLSELGLRPSEIATILGRTQGYVNKELTSLRKHHKSQQ
jgi:hypothetical protein